MWVSLGVHYSASQNIYIQTNRKFLTPRVRVYVLPSSKNFLYGCPTKMCPLPVLMLSVTLKVLVPVFFFYSILFDFPAVNTFCLNEVHDLINFHCLFTAVLPRLEQFLAVGAQ